MSSASSVDRNPHYRLYVRTRSWNTDYRWIGDAPVAEWWKSGPQAQLLTNKTGLYKTQFAAGQRLIITGIAGTRQDSHGTTIRYDLVIEPDPKGLLTDDDVAALIQQYWNSRNNSHLGEIFDRALGAKANSLLEANSAEVATALTAAIQTLPRIGFFPSPHSVTWIGAQHPDALAMMLSSPEVLHSTLLNTEIRDELTQKGAPALLVVVGQAGSGTTPIRSGKALQPAATSSKALATTGGGGCLIAVVALTSAAFIIVRGTND